MKRFHNFIFTGCVFLLIAVSIFISSCQVGLGGTVDYKAPTVTITSHTSGNSVLNGTTEFSGTWEDDTGVTEIDFTLSKYLKDSQKYEEVDTFKISIPSAETEKKSGSWSYEFDTTKYPETDYQLAVVATDTSKTKSQQQILAFSIDNTAPLIILDKPNSLNFNDPALFGREVKISGDIEDAHSIKSLDVKVFKANADGSKGEEITLPKSSFSASSGALEKYIARYYSDDARADLSDEELLTYENYVAIYGDKNSSNWNKNQNYIFEISASDICGNVTDKLYLTDNLKSLIKAALNKDIELDRTEMRNILEDNYTDNALTESQVAVVKEILKGTYDQSSLSETYTYLVNNEDSLYGTINSRANPTYTVSGCILGESTWGLVFSGGTLTFYVKSGSDGASFKPNVINLALYPCDEDGNIIDKVDGTTIYRKIEVPQDYIKNSNNKSIKDLETTVTEGTYSFSLTDMSDSEGDSLFKVGEYYKVEVTGYDLKNNDIIASFDSDDNEYEFGFIVKGDNPEPEVTFANDKEFVKAEGIANTIPVTISVSKAKKVVVSAYAQTKEGKCTFGDAIVTEGTKVIDSKEYALTDGVVTVNVPLNFDVTKLERGKNWTIGIYIVATNIDASKTETFYVYADDAAPEVAFKGKLLTAQKNNYEIGLITEADSLYEKDEKGNCTYTYTGTWSDIGGSGTDKLYYSTDNEKTWSEFDSDEAPQATSKLGWTKALPVTEGGPYTLSFKAKDSVGNESGVITFTGEYFDFAAPTITIEGDKKAYRNDATAPVFTITAEDTNALSALDVVVKKNGTAVDSGNGYTLTKNTDDTKKFTAKVITTEEAEWTIEATAKDCQNRTASIDALSFVYDKTAPKWYEDSTNYVTVDGKKWNAGVENWYNATAMTFKGFLEESVSGIAKVNYVIQPAGTTDEASQISGSVVTTAVKDKAALSYYEATLSGLVSGTEANTVTFTPVDKAGNPGTERKFSIYVDNKTPKLESDVSGTKYTDGKTAVTLTGTVEDDDSGFAADSVVITAGSTNVTATLDTTSEGYSKNKAKWTAEIPADALADNKATDIYATVTDRAKMKITNKLCIYYVDTTAPVVNFKGKLDSALKNSNVVGLITEEDAPDGKFTVSGSWSDVNGSGTSKLYYKFDTDANWNDFGTSEAPTSDSLMNWTKELTVEQGTAERTLSFYAEDKVGNPSDVITFTGIKFDFALPEVKITSGTVADYYKEGDTPEFTVEATDTNKISALNLTVTKDGATVAADDYATAGITVKETTTDNKITKVITLTEDGSWNITAQAVDSTKRESSTPEKISTIFDTKKPVWKEDKDFVPKVGGNPYTTATWYNSTSLQFSGYYTEEGSGISYIEYELYEAGSDVAKTSSTFTTSDKGSYESFEATLSGFIASNSANKVVFTPVDKAGNRGDSKEFEIHVDCSSPTISVDSSSQGNKYAQQNEPITLTGTISDDASGFNSGSVKVKVGNITESAVNVIVDTSSEGYSSTNAKWTATIPTSVLSSLTENEQTVVTVYVSDAATNTSSTTACTIIIDTKKPEISFKNRLGKAVSSGVQSDGTYKVGLITKSDSLNYDSENKKFTYEISGDWTDNKGSGTKLLEYCIDGGDWEKFNETEAPVSSGKTNWSKTLEVKESKKDEAMTLAFRATDGAGLVSDIVTFTDIRFDYESPALSVDKSEIYNYYTADTGAPEFTITAEDTNAIESFEITVTKDGVEVSSGDGYTLVKDTTSTTTQTAKITVSEEAKWSVKTNVADCQGQKSELDTIAFVYDKTAPAWTDEGTTYYTTVGGKKYDSTNPWYKESAMNFKGYVDEAGSGIEKIVWTLTSASGSSDSGEIVATKVDGTDKYSYTQAISGFVSGTNTVTLTLVDKAGNEGGTSKEFTIKVDNTSPVIGTADVSGTMYTKADSDISISGTITDTNGSGFTAGVGNVVVNLKVGDTVTAVNASVDATGTSAKWTATIPADDLSKTAATEITLSVKDNAGNPADQKLCTYYVDTTAPALNFKGDLLTAQSNGNVVGLITESNAALSTSANTYTVSGSWSDEGGSGTSKLYYSTDSGSNWTKLGLADAPQSDSLTNWSKAIPIAQTGSNSYSLKFKAVDDAGNEFISDEFTGIYFDYAKPTVKIEPNTTGYVTSETTYTITAEDTNEVTKVDIVVKKNGTVVNNGDGYTLSAVTTDKTKLVKEVKVTGEAKWEIEATATDVQNRSSDTATVSFTYDKTKPEFYSDDTLYSTVENKKWDSAANNWYNASALTFTGYVKEEVSGVAKVTYEMTPAGSTDKVTGYVVPTAVEGQAGLSRYEVIVSGFASGTAANTITFTAVDNAGLSQSSETYNIYVDRKAPSSLECDVTEKSSYVKTSTSVTLTGTAKDEASGIASVVLTLGNETITAILTDGSSTGEKKWSATIDSKKLSTENANVIYATATDNAGNELADQKLCTYYVDTTAPALNFKGDLLTAQSNSNKVGLITENNAAVSYDKTNNKYTYTLNGSWSDIGGSKTKTLHYKFAEPANLKSTTWKDLTTTEAPQSDTLSNWSTTIDVTESTVAKSLSFYAEDAAGNPTDEVTFTDLTFDFSVPTISITDTVADYYNKTPTFTITAVDGNEFNVDDALTITATKDGATVTSGYTLTKVISTDKKTVTGTLILSDEGKWSITVSAKDAAGRTSTQTVNINTTVDKTAPTWLEDSTHTPTVGGKDWNTDTEATENHSWFKSSSLKFEGYFTESGSGIKEIKWSLTPAGASTATEGTITASDKGTYEAFATTIDGFTAGTNTITFTPVDYAGNAPATGKQFKIYIDDVAPDYSLTDSTAILTNKVTPVTLTGTATDANSGIDSVVVSITGITDASVTAILTDGSSTGEKNWSATFDEDALADLKNDASYSIKVTVKDKAENEVSTTATSISVDTTAPVVTISTPVSTTSLNGNHTLSGKVTETSPKSLELYWSTTNDTTLKTDGTLDTAIWTKFHSATELSGIYNWTTSSLNFTDISKAKSADDGKATVYILPVAKDSAGNCNIYTYDGTTYTSNIADQRIAYTVDMNTDRPVIKFNELEKVSGTLRKYTNQISGTLSDDDTVTAFKIYATTDSADTGIPKTLAEWNSYTQEGKLDWTANSSTTSFTYEPNHITKDGTIYVYFFVTDSEGDSFFTGATSTLSQPYVMYKGTTANVDNSAVITYTTDSKQPQISSKAYYAGDDEDAVNAAATSDAEEIKTTAITIGGKNKKFIKFIVTASDDNGIKSVTGKVNSVELTFTKQSSTETTTTSTWISKAVSVASVTSGQYTAEITVTDNSDLTYPDTISVTVDNDGPEFGKINPSMTAVQVGDVSVSGFLSDKYSSVSTLKYLIGTDTVIGYDDDTIYSTAMADNTQYNAGSVEAFEFDFDNSEGSGESTHTGYKNPKLPTTVAELASYTQSTTDNQIYDIPIYFVAEDELGNYTVYKDFYVHYNPYADRPTTEILYPSNGATLSGQIRLSGSAVDNEEVGSVYYQIMPTSSSTYTTWKAAKEWATSLGLTVVDSSSTELSGGNFDADSDFWGIKATNTVSWYANLNDEVSLIKDECKDADSKNYLITVRAVAIDAKKTLGNWSNVVNIVLNPDAPAFGSIEAATLKQFADTVTDFTTATATSSLEISGTTYLKGQWYYVTTVTHTNGIKEISYSLDDSSSVALVKAKTIQNSNTVKSIGGESDNYSGYQIWIPLGTDSGSGTKTLTVSATTGNDVSGQKTEVFTYDNEAPEIGSLYHTDVDTEFTAGAVLTNNNNQLVIGGTVDDTTAGIDKVLFYFYREGTDTIELAKRIYDPMFNNYDATSKAKSEILTSTLSSEDITTSIPLYGITQTVNVGEDGKTLTLATESDHIRAGGLAKINGIYYTISKVDGTTVTLKTSCGVTGSVSAFFPIAQVVDNTSAEKVSKFTTDAITFTGNTDDGDGMPESLTGTGTTKTWEASIHGNWLPDGPVTLVVIAFDKSGNASATSINASIQNNRPRLSKVFLGTNLDGSTDTNKNATYSDNEFETYNILAAEGAYQEVYELTTYNYNKYAANGTKINSTRSAFIAKNKLAVVPEFVGGNGEIKVIFNNADTTTDADGKMTNKDVSTGGAGPVYALAAKKGTLSGTEVSGDYFEFGTELGDDADSHAVSFTFWDSTELTTPGTDSQYSFLRIKDLKVAQTDSTAPNVVVNPFFWEGTGKGKNSLYEGSTSNGHIELEDDWMATDAYDKSTSGEYDGDPKVSGKIVLRGTAYDDRALAGLYFKVTNSSGTDVFTATGTTTEELSGTNYYLGATYANSTWTSKSSDLATNGWAMTIDSADNAADETYNYFGQDGHKVHWELALDTEKITGVAATDITVTVAAVDTKSNNSTGRAASDATDDATAHKPGYKMDVVPYITGVKSGLSKQKVANSSAYDRTAKGHYPVSSAETVYVTGFNLKGGSLNDSSSTAKTAALTAVTDATSLTWYSSVAVPSGSVYSVASIASFTSGNVSVAVNSISSLNNLNNNDGKGSYTKENTSTIGDYSIYSNYYNRLPNSDNNNLLTDDVVFDVWQFNSTAAKVKESGYLVEPIMKINPKNDMIGFAFNNGPAYFSMANGTSTSFSLWQRNYARNTTTGFTIDSNGVSHGITVGLDTNPNSGHAGRMTYMNSSWGVGYTNGEGGNYNGYHTSRIESIGLPSGTYNGVTYSSKLYVEERFSSPSLTTAVHSDDTYVYLAYYDDVNGQIRFRWGNTSNANSSNGYGYTFDQFADQTRMGITDNSVFESSATYYSVPASSSVKYDGTNIAYAGEYVSIAVVPGSSYKDDVVVMTWYDATESCWWYSYKKNPCNDNDMSSTHTDGYWSTPIMLMDDAGEHCKIAVDANKGIHMAAYDIGDANLVYAYLPTYSSTSPKLAVVDSYSITGTNITLDVGLTTVEGITYAVPHIGYYSASTGKAKVASLNEVISNGYTGDIPAGATSDYFTGDWEVSTLPTTSRLRDDYINVGLWKDTDGKIKAPDASKSSAKTSSQSGDTGYCYGNGTANAVLGYAIKVGTLGYVETAQMK